MEQSNLSTLLEDLFKRNTSTALSPPNVVIQNAAADDNYIVDMRTSDAGMREYNRDALLVKLRGALTVVDRRLMPTAAVKTTSKIKLTETEYPNAAPAIEESDEESEQPEEAEQQEQTEQKEEQEQTEQKEEQAETAEVEAEIQEKREEAPVVAKKQKRVSKKVLAKASSQQPPQQQPPQQQPPQQQPPQQQLVPQTKAHIPPIKINPRYLNNRKMFIGQLTRVFAPYHKEFVDNYESMTCDSIRSQNADAFDLLTHQKVIRDYLYTFTPYRGLVLFHGLGSGKTCTSIAVAESMKSNRPIIFMTPASLNMNYVSEIKKCGDPLYKKLQYWEFVKTFDNPELATSLSQAMQISEEYIKRKRGVWLVNMQKRESNFDTLAPEEQAQVDDQLNEMIQNKYTSINYNGNNLGKRLDMMSDGGKRNPFSGKTIIVDEAHNLVSRIVNSIRKKSQSKNASYKLYKMLLEAENAKVVLLTGTPILNHPFELSILYNMVRGYIDQWTFFPEKTVTATAAMRMFDENQMTLYDIVTADNTQVSITRNPFGFVNTNAPEQADIPEKTEKTEEPYVREDKQKTQRRKPAAARKVTVRVPKTTEQIKPIRMPKSTEQIKPIRMPHHKKTEPKPEEQVGGDESLDSLDYQIGGGESGKVVYDDTGRVSNADFVKKVKKILQDNGVSFKRALKHSTFTALPERPDDFDHKFIDVANATIRNADMFMRRVVGLTSYFRSVEDKLLPRFEKTDDGANYHIVEAPMSDFQFVKYAVVRSAEIRAMGNAAKAKARNPNDPNALFQNSYRIYSRLACNFAFPNEIPRPMPGSKDKEQEILEEEAEEQEDEAEEQEDEEEDKEEERSNTKDAPHSEYHAAIENAIQTLAARKTEFLLDTPLGTYSPKLRILLRNVLSEDLRGLHLIYSQFRTLEGIGIISLILEANGYTRFSLRREGGAWHLDAKTTDALKHGTRLFALYTGTESAEEKEVLRNIYNSAWSEIPSDIAAILRNRAPNNNMGDIIRALLITSSAAEGINLKCTRYVHIVEPYWNMVRVEQVVGRARRICSHQDLPEELRTVKVFFYLTTFSEKQLKNPSKDTEILRLDVGRRDKNRAFTTDQSIYEIADIKTKINNAFLNAVKATAVDCSVYTRTKDDTYVCYGYGRVGDSTAIASYPTLEEDERNTEQERANVAKSSIEGYGFFKSKGVKYGLNTVTQDVYDSVAVESALAQGLELSSLVPIGRLVQTEEGKVIQFYKK